MAEASPSRGEEIPQRSVALTPCLVASVELWGFAARSVTCSEARDEKMEQGLSFS